MKTQTKLSKLDRLIIKFREVASNQVSSIIWDYNNKVLLVYDNDFIERNPDTYWDSKSIQYRLFFHIESLLKKKNINTKLIFNI